MATSVAANPQRQNDPFNARTGINLVGLAANGYATTVTPFLRRGMGSEALGVNGVVALLIIIGYAGVTNSPEMISFLLAWVGALIFQRAYGFNQRRKGQICHSRYAGDAVVGRRFAKSERVAREVVEPLICGFVGVCLWPWSEPVGRFVLCASFSLLVSRGLDTQVTRNRLQKMHDAQIEQRYLSDLFNGRRDEF
jgi:hypothetical protein